MLIIEQIKSALSFESVLTDAGVEIRNNRARCISHNPDNNPSLHIYRGKDGYNRGHCFVCNKSFDVIDAAKEIYGLSTKDAIKYLADKAGIRPGKIDPVKLRDRNERGELIRAFKEWERNCRNELALALRTMRRKLTEGFKITDPWAHAERRGELAYMNYVYDVLCSRDDRAKYQLFIEETGYGSGGL